MGWTMRDISAPWPKLEDLQVGLASSSNLLQLWQRDILASSSLNPPALARTGQYLVSKSPP